MSDSKPRQYDASAEWKGKTVVLVHLPNVCAASYQPAHIPPYVGEHDTLKARGVDLVAFIAPNDARLVRAWAMSQGVMPRHRDVMLMGDTKSELLQEAMGDGRWAMVIDGEGTIKYAESERDSMEVTVSGVEEVLRSL